MHKLALLLLCLTTAPVVAPISAQSATAIPQQAVRYHYGVAGFLRSGGWLSSILGLVRGSGSHCLQKWGLQLSPFLLRFMRTDPVRSRTAGTVDGQSRPCS
jgi:hypothetical protein